MGGGVLVNIEKMGRFFLDIFEMSIESQFL